MIRVVLIHMYTHWIRWC